MMHCQYEAQAWYHLNVKAGTDRSLLLFKFETSIKVISQSFRVSTFDGKVMYPTLTCT